MQRKTEITARYDQCYNKASAFCLQKREIKRFWASLRNWNRGGNSHVDCVGGCSQELNRHHCRSKGECKVLNDRRRVELKAGLETFHPCIPTLWDLANAISSFLQSPCALVMFDMEPRDMTLITALTLCNKWSSGSDNCKGHSGSCWANRQAYQILNLHLVYDMNCIN